MSLSLAKVQKGEKKFVSHEFRMPSETIITVGDRIQLLKVIEYPAGLQLPGLPIVPLKSELSSFRSDFSIGNPSAEIRL